MLIVDQRFAWAVLILCAVPEAASGEVMQSGKIGSATGCKGRYLEPIPQTLTGAGVLDGKRGPRGGYSLVQPASVVSLADIEVVMRDYGRESVRHRAPLSPVLQVIFDGWRADLAAITIALLREPAP